MKSPFTGKEMKRVYERRTWNFRGEQFDYLHAAWLCQDTGEQFTEDADDDASFMQVTNQYRAKYGIPYTDEIVAVRQRYGVSAAKMSQILGIGVNQYRLYEQGEVPSVSNGRMIRSIKNPKVMLSMVESCKNELTASEFDKITNKVKAVIADSESYKIEQYETQRIFNVTRGMDNGYAQTSLVRLKNIMLYLLERCGDVWCTKMNKLLFYVDFLSYRDRGMAMTGLSYRAIDYGPVPEHWDRIYSEFPEVKQELKQVGDFEGNMLTATQPADVSMFSPADIQILDRICSLFGSKSSRELSNISHEEPAWLLHQEKHERIPFEDAFAIKAV